MLKSSVKTLLAFLILTGLWFGLRQDAAAQSEVPHPVHIYIFWGEGCPHCAAAKPWLESLETKYPGVYIHEYEVYYNEENAALWQKFATKYNFEPSGVPNIFIGPYYLEGYTESVNEQFEQVVVECLEKGCQDPGEGIVTNTSTAATATPLPDVAQETAADPAAISQENTLTLPLIGEVRLEKQSLLVSTLLISFVDGFNPCSLWALSMLLALTIHTGSRRKVLVVGLVFITVTAAIYALFIAGLFSVLKVLSFTFWIQVIVALVAAFFALVNIKDYFWFKEGLSFTISDKQKPSLIQRLRRVLDASQSTWGLIGATIVVAAGVSLVEFSCTAGFPVMWTNLLNSQKVAVGGFIGLLLVYMLIYQLDELVIFFAAVTTLKATRLEDKHGRILKLISGVLLLTLAVVMLINPALMNNLGTSLLIFGIAFGVSGLILLVHRVILPKFGIRVGSETKKSRKR